MVQKKYLLDNNSDYPPFRVRELFDDVGIDCFITNQSNNGKIDIKLFVNNNHEGMARALLETVNFKKIEDSCPMCGDPRKKTKPKILTKLTRSRNYCRYCKFKW